MTRTVRNDLSKLCTLTRVFLPCRILFVVTHVFVPAGPAPGPLSARPHVGAWWLGYAVLPAALLPVCAALCAFPRRMPRKRAGTPVRFLPEPPEGAAHALRGTGAVCVRVRVCVCVCVCACVCACVCMCE